MLQLGASGDPRPSPQHRDGASFKMEKTHGRKEEGEKEGERERRKEELIITKGGKEGGQMVSMQYTYSTRGMNTAQALTMPLSPGDIWGTSSSRMYTMPGYWNVS